MIISKRLAEMMGGDIGVESTPGRGSVFWFTISVPSAVPVAEDSEPRAGSITQHGSDLSGLRVLVAEDNSVNQLVIAGMLKRHGIKPVLVQDGLQAVEACQEATQPYDLILMDCEMPVLDGFSATEQIRQWEQAHGLKPCLVCALTAHALTEHKNRCQEAGMNGHLAKPIDKAKLTELLASVADGPSGELWSWV